MTLNRGHTCRLIGLGQVGSASKQQKWLHALALSPMAHMPKADLTKAPPIVTTCPFSADAKQPKPETQADKTATPPEDKEKELAQALSDLLAGDINRYVIAADMLQSNPFICASA